MGNSYFSKQIIGIHYTAPSVLQYIRRTSSLDNTAALRGNI